MKRGTTLTVALLAALTLCLCAVSLTACNNPIDTSLSVDESATLYVGETTQLSATVVNLDGEFVWESSDPETVSLTADGNTATLTALKAGMANVTVQCGGKSATCTVTVNAMTELNDIAVMYDNAAVPTFIPNDTLTFAKLSASSASATSAEYRYTIRKDNGEEQALTADYTFTESGRYTVTAYVTTRGYTGKGMLGITVAQLVTDITVTYNGASALKLVKGQKIEYSKLSTSSQTVQSENLAYRLVLPNSEKIALTDDYTVAEVGNYAVEAYVTGTADYCGYGSLAVTVTDKNEATVAILYNNDSISEPVEFELDSVTDELNKFSISATGGSANFTTQWKLGDGAYVDAVSELSITAVGVYTLTAVSESETHKGTASISLTVYQTHTVTWDAYCPENVLEGDKIALNATASSNKDCVYKMKIGDGEWTTFNGTFSGAGNAKLRAEVYSANGLDRGASAEKSVTVYAIGSEHTVTVSPDKGFASLVLGVKRKVGESADSGTYGNTFALNTSSDVTISGNPTVKWLVLDGTVASYNSNTLTAVAVGTTKLCAIISNKAYPVCDIEVRDLSGYSAITSTDDWLNKLPWQDSTTNYVLTEDLDFAGVSTWKRFNRNNSDTSGLKHVLDGNGHALKNIVVPSGTDQAAFIGQVATGGTIRNIRFLNVRTSDTQTGKYYGLIGFLLGTAENIYAEITIPVGQMLTDGSSYQGEYCMGGLFGQFRGTGFTAKNCVVALNNATPDNLSRTGALAGAISQSIDVSAKRILNCYAIGTSNIPAIYSIGSSAAVAGNEYFGKYDTLAALQTARASLFEESGEFASAFWKNALRSPAIRYGLDNGNAPQQCKAVTQLVSGGSVSADQQFSGTFTPIMLSGSHTVTYKSSDTSVLTVDSDAHTFQVVGKGGVAKVVAEIDGIDIDIMAVNCVAYQGISTVDDWNALPTGNSTANYLLLNDLDFNDRSVSAKFLRGFDGKWDSSSGLKHIFDGNGYAIKNFTAVKTHPSNDEWRGLIGQVAQDGIMRNIKFLGVTGASTNGKTRTGGVISFLCGKAENIYAEVSINTTNSNYTSSGSSAPENSVGGLIGILVRDTGATLTNIIVKATVNSSITDTKSIGGVLGAVDWVTKADCVNNVYCIAENDLKAVAWLDCRTTDDNPNGKWNADKFDNTYSDANKCPDYWATYGTVDALKTAQASKFAAGGVFATDFWTNALA